MSCFGGFQMNRSRRIVPIEDDTLSEWRLPPTMRVVVDGYVIFVPPNYANLIAVLPLGIESSVES